MAQELKNTEMFAFGARASEIGIEQKRAAAQGRREMGVSRMTHAQR
jgi:hypothetical protein